MLYLTRMSTLHEARGRCWWKRTFSALADSVLVEHVLHTEINEGNRQEKSYFVGIWNEQVISTLISVTKISLFSLRGKNGLGIPKQPRRKQVLQWTGPRHDKDVIYSASFPKWFPISHGRNTVQRQLSLLHQEEAQKMLTCTGYLCDT